MAAVSVLLRPVVCFSLASGRVTCCSVGLICRSRFFLLFRIRCVLVGVLGFSMCRFRYSCFVSRVFCSLSLVAAWYVAVTLRSLPFVLLLSPVLCVTMLLSSLFRCARWLVFVMRLLYAGFFFVFLLWVLGSSSISVSLGSCCRFPVVSCVRPVDSWVARFVGVPRAPLFL